MFLSDDKRTLVLQTKSPEFITNLIPTAIVEPDDVLPSVHIPFTFPATRILNSAGVNMDGFEYSRYHYEPYLVGGKHEFYQHQIDAVAFMSTHGRAFNLFPPRLGKTDATEGGIQYLEQMGATSSALVIAPLSTLYSVWESAIGYAGVESVCVLHTTKYTGVNKIAWIKEKLRANYRRYLINPASLRAGGIVDALIEWRISNGVDCFVLDESSEFGNQSSKQWKGLNKVTGNARYIWLLTGTPGNPMKVHGQVRLIYPTTVPSDKGIWQMRTMTEVSKNVWIPKPESMDMVHEVMTPAIRRRREDVFGDMPKLLTIERRVPMSAKAQAVYDIMEADGIVKLQKETGDEIIMAKNAAVLASKLIQISAGIIINSEDGTSTRLPIDMKIEELSLIINQSEGKTIVIAQFREVLKYYNEELLKKGYTTAVVNGGTSAVVRGKIFKSFMANDKPQVLLAHPTTIKFGVELGRASSLVCLSPLMVGEIAYEQVKARLQSTHQKSLTPAVYWLYSTARELKMFNNLERKQAWNTDLADMFLTT